MTTVMDDKQIAQQEGFSLGWLEQLAERMPGAIVENNGTLGLGDIAHLNEQGISEYSENLTGRIRGSIPRFGVPQIGAYPFRTKGEIWGYNLVKLYEEAVARQWSSATDIPWETLKPLPDDIEAAECQLATFFTEVEFIATDVPARYISTMSPDYQEVRLFLLSQVMDESRHLDVFRKRALANGGGLMRRIDTISNTVGGTIDDAREFTELSSRLHVTGEGAVLTLFRLGELMGYSEAEKMIYRRAAQDEARHVAFGVLHLRYMNDVCDASKREEIHTYLDEGEFRQATGAGGANPAGSQALTGEALALLLGGGADKMDEGVKILTAVRQRQIKEYFQRLKSAGFDDRVTSGRVRPELLQAYQAAS